MKICPHCSRPHAYSTRMCFTCYYYKHRTGRDRPLSEKDKPFNVRPPRICTNCGYPHSRTAPLCGPCNYYEKRHNERRPPHLYERRPPHLWGERVCTSCGKSRESDCSRSPLCFDCRNRHQKNPVRAMETLTCECGQPATIWHSYNIMLSGASHPHKITIPLCRSCYDMETGP